jgi:hypothetical protein
VIPHSALPDRPDPPEASRPTAGPGSVPGGAKRTRRHVTRILLVALGVVIYVPATVLMTIQVAGASELQALFDWLTGRCGATCSAREALATATEIAPIVITAPCLGWIAYIWIRRGRRDDRQVGAIERYLETAPERVSPHAIEEDEAEDRYLYRDRQGRLRPVYPPAAPPD